MQLSNHKLRTMDSDYEAGHLSTLHQHQHQQPYLKHNRQFPKQKKQSNRKISLKQSTLKQVKDLSINQLLPTNKYKKSHHHHHQHISAMTSNNNNNNKSLILSQQKLTNPHHYSVIKTNNSNSHVKVINNSEYSKFKDNNKQLYGGNIYNGGNVQGSGNKRQSTIKNNTTKKHSKSVYNCYTEFDDCLGVGDKKKYSNKQQTNTLGGGRKSRDSHNRSTLTQHNPHHQISTSSITKRVNKSKQTFNKLLLNNTSIKKTTQNFKVLSNCLRQYIKEQQIMNNKIDVGQIIKMVRAFNKTEIGHLSKPLEELVCEMLGLIQVTVEKDKGKSKQKEKEKQKGKQKQQSTSNFKKQKNQAQQKVKFQTPQRLSFNQNQQTFPSSINQHHKTSDFTHDHNFDLQQQQQQHHHKTLTPNDISKTKKFENSNNKIFHHYQHQHEQYHESSISNDLITMQHGLQQLKSQSKHLQKIIASSGKKKRLYKQQQQEQEDSQQQQQQHQQHQQNQQEIQQKKIQIHRLKKILQKQKYLMEKIQTFSQSEGSNREQQESYYQSGDKSGMVRQQ